jgi:hypothetical protein
MNIIRPLSSLKVTALRRKPGYLAECHRSGKVTGPAGSEMVEFTPAQHAAIRSLFRLQPSAPISTPRADVNKRAQRSDAGKSVIKSICQACEWFTSPNCCRAISNCAGGLQRFWASALSSCPKGKWKAETTLQP